MVHITSFNDPWYHQMMNRFQEELPENTPLGDFAVAKAIVLAGCLISQAIDCAFSRTESHENSQSAFADIASAIERLGDLYEEKGE